MSTKLIETMDTVRNFLFSHGILGQKAKSVDAIGIAFPDDQVLGVQDVWNVQQHVVKVSAVTSHGTSCWPAS